MRRPRYKGKHPRRPEEKYKELNPAEYAEDIAHINAKGRTPLGTHKPIMVEEILKALNPVDGDRALDLTLGYGGHSVEILEKIGPKGKLLALDQDPIEINKTTDRLRDLGFDESRFTPIHSNFRHLKKVLQPIPGKFDVVLADLGLSSMQIDKPERGFSSKFDTSIDFRMNPQKGKPAIDLLKKMELELLKEILVDYGDEPHPHRIASGILQAVKEGKIETTKDLKRTVVNTVAKIKKYPLDVEKVVPRVFQALRIYINEELHCLEELLTQLPDFLNPGARVAFLTFHSGEDRLVKKFFKQGHFEEAHGPARAGISEVTLNRRARSAKLRWARALGSRT